MNLWPQNPNSDRPWDHMVARAPLLANFFALILVFIIYGGLSLFSIHVSADPARTPPYWFANGFLLAWIIHLRTPRERVLIALSALAAHFFTMLFTPQTLPMLITFALINGLEITVGSILLLYHKHLFNSLSSLSNYGRLLVFGAFIPALLSAFPGAWLYSTFHPQPYEYPIQYAQWALASIIGSATTLPLIMAICEYGRQRIENTASSFKILGFIAASFAITVFSLTTLTYPFIYVSFGLLVVSVFCPFIITSAVCALQVALIYWLWAKGLIWPTYNLFDLPPLLPLSVAILITIVSTLGVSVGVARIRQLIASLVLSDAKLRQSESFLQRVTEVSGVGGWVYDPATRKTFINGQLKKILGFELAHQRPILETLDWVCPEYRRDVQSDFERCLNTGASFEREVQITDLAGHVIWVHLSGVQRHSESPWIAEFEAPPLGTNEQISKHFTTAINMHLPPSPNRTPPFIIEKGNYVMGTVRDISLKKTSQNVLVQALQEAKNSSEVKGQFLANISHEIRTPLSSIIGLTQLLAKTPTDATTASYVSKIDHASRTLLRLVNDVLDLRKMEAGHIQLEPVPLDLVHVVSNVCELFSPSAVQKGLIFKLDVAPNCTPYILADELRLRQVLTNLLHNAVKFTHTGAIIVRLTTRPDESISAHMRVSLSVQDTGLGIDPKTLDRLLTLPLSPSNSNPSILSGSGLGLSISQAIAQLMNGSIDAVSHPQSGSTFTLNFCAPVSVRALPALKTRTLEVALVQSESQLLHVHLLSLFALLGWHPTVYPNGQKLLGHLKKTPASERPDALVFTQACSGTVDELESLYLDKDVGSGETGDYLAPPRLPLVFFATEPNELVELLPTIAALPNFCPLALSPHALPSVAELFNLVAGLYYQTHGSTQGLLMHHTLDGTRLHYLGGLRILVVDASPMSVEVVQTHLSHFGAKVVKAHTAQDALLMLGLNGGTCEFDAVLIDQHMPDLDAHELALRIRTQSHLSAMAVVAMSATPSGTAQSQLGAFDAFVLKPVDERTLLTHVWLSIERHLGHPPLVQIPPPPLPTLLHTPFGPSENPGVNIAGWPHLSQVDSYWAQNHFVSDQAFYLRMLGLFYHEFKPLLDLDLQEFLMTETYEQIAHQIHKLVAQSGTLGARVLWQSARNLESLMAQHTPAAEVTGPFTELLAPLGALIKEIEPYLPLPSLPPPMPFVPSGSRAQAGPNVSDSSDLILTLFSELEHNQLSATKTFAELFSFLSQNMPPDALLRLQEALLKLDYSTALTTLKLYTPEALHR